MIVTCLFFAYSKDLAGTPKKQFELPEGTTIQTFIEEYLLVELPRLKPAFSSFLLSINEEYVDQTIPHIIPPNAELAIIPPVSGG